MSNDKPQQQPTPPSQGGPVRVKALYFLAPGGVVVSALRGCSGTTPHLFAGKHAKGWMVEIVREPWHRVFRVTETEEAPPEPWGKVRVAYIPESAASYVPEAP